MGKSCPALYLVLYLLQGKKTGRKELKPPCINYRLPLGNLDWYRLREHKYTTITDCKRRVACEQSRGSGQPPSCINVVFKIHCFVSFPQKELSKLIVQLLGSFLLPPAS